MKPKSSYLYGNTPAALLQDLQMAWKMRDITRYAELLADDFRFYFDPDTRQMRRLPEFWDKETDVAYVGMLFDSPDLNAIRITLTYNPTPEAHENPGWELIRVPDEYLEVELKPAPGEAEGITLIVDGQVQEFAFRKGRTAADTLDTSPTAHQYYIVEWRDQGLRYKATDVAIRSTTWSGIKAMYVE